MMSTRTTRTLNPLHFEDLEPHRFEDLVRQLAYQFRTWRTIEATGRPGADEGIDIRAAEIVGQAEPEPSGDEPEESVEPHVVDRLWIFQCKRERTLGPAAVRRIIQDAIPAGGSAPYGFVLAAACDLSLRARNELHEEARARGVQEIQVWGKAELEDMLFLPANDHLLFAYFNISLQVRRRSLRTELRSRLATKRALIRALGGTLDSTLTLLLRDPREERYPHEDDISDFAEFPRWRYATCVGHRPPDHLMCVIRKHFAYVDDAGEHWDAMFGFADIPCATDVDPRRAVRDRDRMNLRWRFMNYWNNHVGDRNRGFLSVMRTVHYDRILAIDEHGDSAHSGVQLLVEFDREHGPFEPATYCVIEYGPHHMRRPLRADESDRITFFPSEIPDEEPIPPPGLNDG